MPRKDPAARSAYEKEWRERNKEHRAAVKKAWVQANFEKQSQKQKDWRANNKERVRANLQAYYAVHKEGMLERAKQYYQETKPERAAAMRKWQRENAGKVNAYCAERNTRKLQASPKWADKDAIKEKYEEAAFLTDILGEPYHVDHIVPLKSPFVCGLHVEFNLQVIPGSENCSKQNRHWPDMP
jgi:hypothetical protein